MEHRYRYAHPRPRSPPTYNPARASLPINLNGHASHVEHHLSIVPTSRREVITTPRGASSTSSSTPSTITTTYKIKADPQPRGSSVRESSRTRRSNTVDSSSRPAVVTTVAHKHRPIVHVGRPDSPMKNPYRSSDEEYYAIPASSQRHHPQKRYSATLDSMDMNRLAAERDYNRLREPPGRGTLAYSGSRVRPLYPQVAVRHADTVADDYGDDGYGYTNPRDLVQYDLNHNTSRTRPRRDSFDGSRSRPTSITGYNEIVPRTYEPRERGPPPSIRGFDKLPRGPPWEHAPQIRMPSIPPMDPVQRPAKVSPPFEEQSVRRSGSHRPKSYHAEPRGSSKDNYFEVRDEEPRRERAYRHEPRYDDAVEQRGFGVRQERAEKSERSERPDRTEYYDRGEVIERDRPEKYERPSKSGRPERAERERERERDRDRDRYDRPERSERSERSDKPHRSDEHSEHKGRDALAAGIGLAGAALGLNAVKHAKRDERDEKDDREDREERKRRDYDEEPRRHKEAKEEFVDLSGRDPKERRRRDDDGNRDVPYQPKDRSPPRDVPPPSKASPPVDRETRQASEPGFIELSRNSTRERAPSRSDRDSDSDRQTRHKHRPEPIRTASGSEGSGGEAPPARPRSRAGKDAGAGVPAFNPKDAMDLIAMKAALNAKDNESSPKVSPKPSPKTSQEITKTRDGSIERQSRDADVSNDNRQVRVVSPPREEPKPKVKGILRTPRAAFPEDPSPVREGVAPLKDAKKDGVPPDARWTKISRKLVSPGALELGKERYEAREDFVIVLRVLSRDEVQGYAEVTQKLRAAREEAEEEEAAQARRRARRERHERHKRERKEGERSERRRHQSHDESDTTEEDDEDERPKMLDAPPPGRPRANSANRFEDMMMSGGLGAPSVPPSISATVSSGDSRDRR